MRLSILNKQTQEPMLVLDQDDYGLSVVGGDTKLVQALKLNQFKDLKEIADYLNSDPNGPYLAQFEDEEEQPKPEDQQKPLDDRMKPALQVIKEMMSRVKNRQDQEKAKEEAEKPEAQILNTTDSQVMFAPGTLLYVSYDGDNIGNAVARAERKDDEQELRQMSARINAGQDLFKEWAKQNGGEVIEQGGDEGLAKVPTAALDRTEEFRKQYYNLVGATASIGIGKKISEATDARMLAKLKGKNCTEMFTDSTRKELELRLEEKGDAESKKIAESLAPHSETDQAQSVAPTAQPQADTTAQPQPEQPQPDQVPQVDGQQVPASNMSPELISGLREMMLKGDEDQLPQASAFDGPNHDSQIEQSDYGYSDNPDFSKALRYAAKYGDGK